MRRTGQHGTLKCGEGRKRGRKGRREGKSGRVRVLEGGRFALPARKHRLAATGSLPGIINWSQGVQANAASDTERGRGT